MNRSSSRRDVVSIASRDPTEYALHEEASFRRLGVERMLLGMEQLDVSGYALHEEAYALVVVAIGLGPALGCKPKSGSSSADASVSTASSVDVTARPSLPSEPAPPVADKASQVPGFEAALASNAAYQAVWTGSRTDINAFLSSVSSVLATGTIPTTATGGSPTSKKLDDAAIKLFLIVVRVGKFPADFTTKFAAQLEATKAEPHLGVWSPFAKGKPTHDYSGLAAWSRPEEATYLRELIAAKQPSAGPFPWESWSGKEPPTRPWLVDEAAALDRLALLTKLSTEEQARSAYLRAEAKKPKQPKLGEDFRLGDFTYAVKSVEVVDEAGSGFAKKKASEGAQFVLVHFAIKNEGNKTATVSTDDFKIVDAKGREFRPSSEANTALSMSGGKDFLVSELQPGIKKNTVTAFEMPEDAAKGVFTLVVPEKGFLGTGSVRITLK